MNFSCRVVQASFSIHWQVLRILAIVLLPLLCGPIRIQKRSNSILAVCVMGPTSDIISWTISSGYKTIPGGKHNSLSYNIITSAALTHSTTIAFYKEASLVAFLKGKPIACLSSKGYCRYKVRINNWNRKGNANVFCT